MFNHHRGLWGYTGAAPDERPMTIQATGMGGPSAAIVAEELIGLGARTLIRVGTCGAIAAGLELGDVLVATGVLARDGTSTALGADGRVEPDRALTAALEEAAHGRGEAHSGPVVSTDLFYDDRPRAVEEWRAEGALAVEMEAAAILCVAERRGARAACLLAVSDLLGDGAEGGRQRIDREGIELAGIRLGDIAVDALLEPGSRS